MFGRLGVELSALYPAGDGEAGLLMGLVARTLDELELAIKNLANALQTATLNAARAGNI